MLNKSFAVILVCSAIAGCASPTVVQEKQVGDQDMTCDQLKVAMEEAQEFEKKARAERQATGTNVAAAIFFWPGLIATYSNTEDAINAAKERQNHLMKIYDAKICIAAKGATGLEQQLRQLQKMRDDGLITEPEYQKSRQKLLGI